MKRDWYAGFFEGVVLDLWEQAASPEMTEQEVTLLQRTLQLEPGTRVLDVACGMGRHSIELARRGLRMTGVDLSEQAIERARAGAIAAGLEVAWHRSDMRDLPWEAEFDAGYCLGNSFGYLDRDGTRAFLAAVSRALKPGARFALDYGLAAECILPRRRDREWARIGEILFLEENQYHVRESCVETTYSFVRGAETVTRTGFQGVFTVRDVCDLLDEAGFEVDALLQTPSGEPFEVGAPCLFVAARKR